MSVACPECLETFDELHLAVGEQTPTHDHPKPTRRVCPGSHKPLIRLIYVVVHGSSYCPEAFDTQQEADEFAERVEDDYVSGPWQVCV